MSTAVTADETFDPILTRIYVVAATKQTIPRILMHIIDIIIDSINSFSEQARFAGSTIDPFPNEAIKFLDVDHFAVLTFLRIPQEIVARRKNSKR